MVADQNRRAKEIQRQRLGCVKPPFSRFLIQPNPANSKPVAPVSQNEQADFLDGRNNWVGIAEEQEERQRSAEDGLKNSTLKVALLLRT